MSKSKSDHVLALVKAGLNLLPSVGGALASLIGDYVPTHTQKGIDTALQLLQEQLERLADRIDAEAINKDEFAELFKSCYLSIIRTHHESKLRAAAGLISNLLLKEGDRDKLSYTELDHFVRCIENLSIGALNVLAHAAKLAKQRGGGKLDSGDVRLDFRDLQTQEPDMSPQLLMGLVGELNSCNLLHIPQLPSVRTPGYGNYPIEFTALGARFVTRVLEL